jgi:DNA-binding winged helix-turn-helix (wHTH) protein
VISEFGPFRLDEPGRALMLAEREIALQPLVFDLLVHLVRNTDRVVSKDELLDTLWPDVIVTENSLQRAVSMLRGVLREGGMERALRNFPGKGYRFTVEAESEPAERIDAGHRPAAGALEDADKAIAEQRWHDAVAVYERHDHGAALAARDLDNWGLALQCLGRQPEAIPVLVRAVSTYSRDLAGNDAARCAVSLSALHFERNESAIAKGWLARAQALVADAPVSKASGRVLWLQSRFAAGEGDMHGALELAEAAYDFGLRHGEPTSEALGLMYRGFYRLALGDTEGGLADQDHASAFALSKSLDPVTGGTLYCNILWACRSFGDWSRANQWTLGYKQFCADSGMEFSGPCQLHRAEVLGIRGSLKDGLAHINEAISALSDEAPWSVGDAHRVLGDLHAAIGNVEQAREAYSTCHAMGWNADPGYAMLLLELGDAEGAHASLERSLIGHSWWTLQRQGILLAHLALVAAHCGRTERAKALIADLGGQGERWPMPSIRALTNEAAARLARDDGDANEALRHLQLARQLWTSVESRTNAARLRLEIAAMQAELGDRNGATVEVNAALMAAAELQSENLERRGRIIQQQLQSGHQV